MLRLRTGARPAPEAVDLLVDYFYLPDSLRGGALVRRSQPLADGEGDQVRYEIVAVGLAGVALRYFDGAGWSDHWDASRPAPPELVELTLTFLEPRGGETVYRQALPVPVETPLLPPAGREEAP